MNRLPAYMSAIEAVAPPPAMRLAAQEAPARSPRPLILAIDFDETLASTAYPLIRGLMPGAKEAMLHFKEQGHTLILWTCRCGEALQAAVDFLAAEGVPIDYVNTNTPALIEEWGSDSRKIFANLYLDDRAAGTPNNWAAYRRLVDHHAQALAL